MLLAVALSVRWAGTIPAQLTCSNMAMPLLHLSVGDSGKIRGAAGLSVRFSGATLAPRVPNGHSRHGERTPAMVNKIGFVNANSITLEVEHAGRRMLLPGDLESPGLEDLMSELPHDCDVLLAPHHGSARSDPPGFAAWSTPEWVVVSSGNADVRPSVRSYELAGAAVFQTNFSGTVEFGLNKDKIQADVWRPSEIAPLATQSRRP